MKIRRLSLRELEKLTEKTRMRDKAFNIAREVLVNGASMTEAGDKFGVSKQRVSDVIVIVQREFEKENSNSTKATCLIELEMPPALAAAFNELNERMAALKPNEREATFNKITATIKRHTAALSSAQPASK